MGRIADLRKRVRGISYGTVWLCDCCHLAAHGYECCQLEPGGHAGLRVDARSEPLSKLDGRWHLTPGMVAPDHDDDCEVNKLGEWPDDYECDCEREHFRARWCAGCDDYIAGSWEAFTLWREPQRFYSRIAA